ncbi:MAG: hypothetical protein QOK38_3727 [Acidobacteriaceae bacterium]|jgi:hypothetical protein|nr:hypothetical protein [Acidobacteriaceae bacterium]
MATQSLPAFRFTTRFSFQHVPNGDGTSDSICLRCHSAIASSYNEYSLEQAESTHTCTQVDLLARTSAK